MFNSNSFFFDTYALFEIVHANPNYKKYSKDVKILTTKMNLMELHYRILSLYGNGPAEKIYEKFREFAIEIPNEVIKHANYFKLSHKKRKLSYVDCLGYVLSKTNNVKFLTGDKEFKDLDNVEFMK